MNLINWGFQKKTLIFISVKEATEHECEKQELLNEMKMLNQKIDELDQLRLSKENFDIYISPQAEADNIMDIPPNAINNNLEGIEYDVEQEELGAAVAAANGGNGSVENHYGKPELHVDSPVRTLPKSGARNNMDSNITKFEEIPLLVSLKLEESQKSRIKLISLPITRRIVSTSGVTCMCKECFFKEIFKEFLVVFFNITKSRKHKVG